MKPKYERACVEAGLSKEKTAAIRNLIDGDKKKRKRQIEQRQTRGITFSSIDSSDCDSEEAGDIERRELVDDSADLEEAVIHQLMLERLRWALEQLTKEEKELILVSFEKGGETKLSLALGVPRSTIQYRKAKLVEKLQKMFFRQSGQN